MARRATLLHLDEVSVLNEAELVPWKAQWTKILIDPVYMGVLACLNVLFSTFLVLVDRTTSYWKDIYFMAIVGTAITLNMIYVIDLVINFVVLGPTTIWKEKKYIYYELLL